MQLKELGIAPHAPPPEDNRENVGPAHLDEEGDFLYIQLWQPHLDRQHKGPLNRHHPGAGFRVLRSQKEGTMERGEFAKTSS